MTDDEMIHCQEPARQVERAVAIMHRLRQPGGCPWDAEQTHESIKKNLIEETYEAVEAINKGDNELLVCQYVCGKNTSTRSVQIPGIIFSEA